MLLLVSSIWLWFFLFWFFNNHLAKAQSSKIKDHTMQTHTPLLHTHTHSHTYTVVRVASGPISRWVVSWLVVSSVTSCPRKKGCASPSPPPPRPRFYLFSGRSTPRVAAAC
uniref:Putative secreted protein n=1 Tax=Anopheles darlingi TaxID=43151 RepID=A0A2M4DC48_ANODA